MFLQNPRVLTRCFADKPVEYRKTIGPAPTRPAKSPCEAAVFRGRVRAERCAKPKHNHNERDDSALDRPRYDDPITHRLSPTPWALDPKRDTATKRIGIAIIIELVGIREVGRLRLRCYDIDRTSV